MNSEVGTFHTGDLVMYIRGGERSSRFYMVIRSGISYAGVREWECWDPKIRGYTRFYDFDLRIVSPYSDRVQSSPPGVYDGRDETR